MKKIALTLAMGLMISGSANAALEANIGATSNYMWRGATASSEDAAISGGLDYSHDSGAYAGIWTSSTDSTYGTEIDYYGGFGGETASGVGYDLGYIYYAYTGSTVNDFAEVYGSVTMSGVTAGVASEVYTQGGTDLDQTYYSLSSDFELTDGFGLTATAGRYNRDGSDDYSHLTFDVTKDDFTFSLSKASSGSGDNSVIPYVSYSKTF
jgi:uncharacterized protein (TIGR02001 family)